MLNSSNIQYFNYNIDNLSMLESIEKIKNSIRSNAQIHHVVLNVAKLVQSRQDPLLQESIESADIINIDGAGIIYGMRLLGLNPKERVAGIDLMKNLLAEAENNKFSVYFLGATDEVLKNLISSFKIKFPNLRIAGFHNGYFESEEEKLVVNEIASLRPNIIFVGISSPKKEIFIKKYKKILKANFIMGVGGSFDIFAGKTKRAPLILQNYGLEWLYRCYQEPTRLLKRYIVTNTIYLFLLIKECYKNYL